MEKSKQEQIQELMEYSKKEKRVKQKIRYDAVLLYMEGYKRKEVAQIMHMPESTVNYHIRNYKKKGIEGLIIKKQPGQSKKMTDEQERKLVEIISTMTPEEAGIGIFANWTSPLICELVKRLFGIQIHFQRNEESVKQTGIKLYETDLYIGKSRQKETGRISERRRNVKKNC